MIDLHIHTCHSADAFDEPRWALERADGLGLSAIAIADHQSLGGFREARSLSGRYSVRLVPGIEFSAKHVHRGRIVPLHILCYLFRDEGPLDDLVRRQQQHSQRYLSLLFEGLDKLGIAITPETVRKEYPGRQLNTIYVRRQMRALGLAEDKPQSWALEHRATAQATNADLREQMPLAAVLGAMKASGGVAIFAHPFWPYHEHGALCDSDVWSLIDEALGLGVDGVEVWNHGRHGDYVEQMLAFARRRRLPVSGGTDSHSARGVHSPLGSLPVPDWALDTLERYQRSQDPWEGLESLAV